jgi:hypothetical protein
MKKNMGGTDRIFRTVLALLVGVLYWQGIIDGILAYVLIAFAFIFVLTSLIGFCPLYRLVGLNTCPGK